MEVSCASTACLDEGLLSSRGHPGAVASAERLRSLLKGSILTSPLRAPDDFSIRCAPAVLGTCWEALEQAETWVLRELNGACDNPLVLPHGVIEGGNFHGAPVGVAMDLLKIALTQLASMSERRTYKMTHGDLSGDLPSFLVESTGLNSGLMLAQYTAASLVSECKGFAHPASVDSIPTGHHHEDHVSMAPIAARSALKCLDCVIAVIAIEALVAAQGADLRCEYGAPDLPALGASAQLAPRSQLLHDAIREVSPRWREDRVLYRDLEAMIAWLRGRLLP